MKAPSTPRSHALAWAALLALLTALFINQLLTLPKLRDLVVADTTKLHIGQAQGAALDVLKAGWRSVLGTSDVLVLGILTALLVWMVVSELRTRRYSSLLTTLESRPRGMLLLLLLLGTVVTRYYLNRGAVFMGDATMHLEVSAAVAEHVRRLSAPVWSNYWYGGFPLLEFYAPLYFYVTGAITALLGDLHSATKLVLWASHLGSMVTMYLFLVTATRRPADALLGALCYGLAFHHMHIILYRGDLHMALIYLLYPTLFMHVERHVRGALDLRGAFLRLAFSAFLLIIAHHAYAFFGLVFFSLYALLRYGCDPARRVSLPRAVAPLLLALTGGAAMATFLLLPAVADQAWVRGMPGLPFMILVPTPPRLGFLKAMLDWQLIGNRNNISYLGISVAALAVLGAIHAWRRRDATALGLLAGGLYALFTLRSGFQYNVKNMNFVVFYSAALAGFAPAWLATRRVAWASDARLPLSLLALVLLDLGPTTFQYVYRDNIDFKEQMYARIRAADGNYRTVERQLIFHDPAGDPRQSFDVHMLGSVMPTQPLASPFGWVHEAAGLSFAYAAEVVKQMHRELHDNQLSTRTLDGLFMFGVKFVSFRDRTHYFNPPLPPAADYTLSDGLLELRDARPLIAAPRLLPATDIAVFDPHNVVETRAYHDDQTFDYANDDYARLIVPLLDAMRIDRTRGTAAAIPVLGRAAATLGDGAAAPLLDIEEFKVDIDHASIGYRAAAASFAQLSFSYFPYLDVRLDGQPLAFSRSAFNLLVVELPAGRHVVSIEARVSPLRRTAFLITLAATVLVILIPTSLLRRLAGGTHSNRVFPEE